MISLTGRPVLPLAIVAIILLAALVAPLPRAGAGAEEPASADFARAWARTDLPVRDQVVDRTWVWGPAALTPGISENYADAPGGQRTVQYFDKARMEISNDPDVGPDSFWYVTTGLLPLEMMTGKLQTGKDLREQHAPADINIAGDQRMIVPRHMPRWHI